VIYIWDVETGKQTAVLKGEAYGGVIIAYHRGRELLASRGWRQILRLWDTRTDRQLLSRPSNWSSTLQFTRSGRWLCVDASRDDRRRGQGDGRGRRIVPGVGLSVVDSHAGFLPRESRCTPRVADSLLDALVDVDEVLRAGRAFELRRPRLAFGVKANFQRVGVGLVDARHDRPLVRVLEHCHIDRIRRLGWIELRSNDIEAD
jgi:hypothetical protein